MLVVRLRPDARTDFVPRQPLGPSTKGPFLLPQENAPCSERRGRPMYAQSALFDLHLQLHREELERQVAHDRLVAEALRFRRPLRARLAEALYGLAIRVEGQPRPALRDELTATASVNVNSPARGGHPYTQAKWPTNCGTRSSAYRSAATRPRRNPSRLCAPCANSP